MTTSNVIDKQLDGQGYHVYSQLERLVTPLNKNIEDLATEIVWGSELSEDTVLQLLRGQMLPGTVYCLQRMLKSINCNVRLTMFPLDNNDRSCAGSILLDVLNPRVSSKKLGTFLCTLRKATEEKRQCKIQASSLEKGIRSQTFAGLMRALASLGLKVRVYVVRQKDA